MYAARSCIFYAVVIHLAATRDKHVVVDRRLGPGPEEQTDVGGPCPGLNFSTGSSRQRQPLGQMVRSRALAAVHEMHPLTLSCLTMAPSITSQWNQRKLAPNYRLLSVRNGTGAGGVCQRVEVGWLTHCETKADHAEDIQNIHTGHRGHTSDCTHICMGTSLLSGWFVPQQGLLPHQQGCHNRNHLCSISDPKGLITHTMEADASGFYAPQAPLCWGKCS